ncbi:MAG: diguanylate cyclase [Chloroflexota bacterium]
MSIQSKTLLIIGLTLIALIAVLYTASRVIVLGSFAQQEAFTTQQNVERVQGAIDDNLIALEGTTRDWSIWDDTYKYIQTNDQEYFTANLADNTTMTSNRLNLMLFADLDGRIIFQKNFNYLTGELLPNPASLKNHIYNGSPLLRHPNVESSLTGILALPEAPMLIASEPVVHSNSTGPVAGTIIFGRLLDTGQMQSLAATTLLDLTLQPIDTPNMPTEFRDAFTALVQAPAQASPIHVQPLNQSSVAGYTLLSDIYKKPVFILKAEMPRDVYERGQDTIQYYAFTLIIAGVTFGIVVLLLLKTIVLSRLARLNRDTASIAASSNMSGRVAVSGSDELANLGTSMNKMLSALQLSHDELKEGEERYRAVVEQTSEAIFLIDTETQRFIQANASSQILLGYTLDELQHITFDDVLILDKATPTIKLHNTTGSLRLSFERRYRRKDGTIVHVEVSDSHITYGGRDVLCVVARDITDRKRAERILHELAMRDGLTSLYNRREMQRILQEAAERYQRFDLPAALIMIDIDHFKSVNDTYGHNVGDDVLRWISRLLVELVRDGDKVARFGGEELAVILPDTDLDTALEIAERLRRAVATQPFQSDNHPDHTPDDPDSTIPADPLRIPITISLGVAVLNRHIPAIQPLIEAADQALYEAKRNGRNCTVPYHTVATDLHEIR